MDNIEFLVKKMPEEGVLILVDLNYKTVANLMDGVEQRISENPIATIVRSLKTEMIKFFLDQYIPVIKVPEVIRSNFYAEKDWLRPKFRVEFSYLAVYKPLKS